MTSRTSCWMHVLCRADSCEPQAAWAAAGCRGRSSVPATLNLWRVCLPYSGVSVHTLPSSSPTFRKTLDTLKHLEAICHYRIHLGCARAASFLPRTSCARYHLLSCSIVRSSNFHKNWLSPRIAHSHSLDALPIVTRFYYPTVAAHLSLHTASTSSITNPSDGLPHPGNTMSTHTFTQNQNHEQYPWSDSHSLQAGSMENNAYNIWNGIQQHYQYNEYRRQIHACIQVHDTAFAHYSALRMDPLAAPFTEALSLSIRLVPPTDLWNHIVRLRLAQNFSAVRNIILAEIERYQTNQCYIPASGRSSGASYRSLAHLSTQSGSSLRSSGVSSTTSTGLHFGFDEGVSHENPTPSSATSLLGNMNIPDPPPIVASARVQRRAPEGQCFVCPSKECKGKAYFRRQGDWTNHIERNHRGLLCYDPSRFLCKDPRDHPTQPIIKSEASEKAAAILLSEVTTNTARSRSPAHGHVSGNAVHTWPSHNCMNDLNPTLAANHVTTLVPPPGHYRATGIEPLVTEILSQPTPQDQELSWFDHEDSMEQN